MTPQTDIQTTFRKLTAEEIGKLKQNGCTAEEWQQIEVSIDFIPERLENVHFSGTNRLGTFRKEIISTGGVKRRTGIRHATLHNTTVGDECLIERIDGHIAHYDIAAECVILHTDTIEMTGKSAFGEGTELCVMSESGGRELIIHERLSSQEAYMQVMHRQDGMLTHRLREIATECASRHTSTRGSIGKGSYIQRCGLLRNVRIGSYCRIEGATRLEDGTICSRKDAPAYIGDLVIARHFIIQTDCHISDGAMLTRCYVGQASAIGHGFSATDTYFACNCQAENGEACAVMAGPFTVSHHKSSLLIGGMFSFMNAGSGTNQSNHAYKLGPRHHGVMERGCKTASGSHISWPARFGAFSLVLGDCPPRTDSHFFPFSYVIGNGKQSHVIPGITLRGAGTLRDTGKWATRDGRSATSPRLDRISFQTYSPYTINRMCGALSLLTEIKVLLGNDTEETEWNGLTFKRKSVENGIEWYQMAIDRYVGEHLINRMEDLGNITPDKLYDSLAPSTPPDAHWTDTGGLLAPANEIDTLERDIAAGACTTIEELEKRLDGIQEKYKTQEWAWIWQQLHRMYPTAGNTDFVSAACIPAVRKWETAAVGLNQLIIADAYKDFDPQALAGFGIDGDDSAAAADARAVRGTPEECGMIKELKKQQAQIKERAARLLQRL